MKSLLKQKVMLLCLTAPLLVACHPFVQYPYNSQAPQQIGGATAGGAATGAVLGSAGIGALAGAGLGAYIHSPVHWLKRLQADGVQVIQTGYLVRIVIPSDKIFIIGTDSINPHSYPILSDVAHFIENYGNVNLTVSCFTDNVGGPDASLYLSNDQAKSVVAYLWSVGFPSGNLRAFGFGQDQPIADNIDSIGAAWNRRIEITFAYTTCKS